MMLEETEKMYEKYRKEMEHYYIQSNEQNREKRNSISLPDIISKLQNNNEISHNSTFKKSADINTIILKSINVLGNKYGESSAMQSTKYGEA